jgi:hypothetical protein
MYGMSMTMKTIVTTLSLALIIAFSGFAKNTDGDLQITKSLMAVPAAEMPATAAQLVKQAVPDARSATTVAVVKGAIALRPTAAALVVAAISKAVPEMASIAASTAAGLQPGQVTAIAKAAAAAAPAQAGRIVFAVCREVPTDYRKVALGVSEAVPNANKEILASVGAAVPSLKPAIDQASSIYAGASVSPVSVLDRVSTLSDLRPVSLATPRSPVVLPPYNPLPGPVVNMTPNSGQTVPEGGRNYTAP